MKKMIVATLFIALFLSACGGIKADVPDNADAKATQILVEKYISANENYDADLLMSLYADDLVWMDYGLNDGPFSKGNLGYFVQDSMSSKDFKIEFDSYLVTPDGRFSVAQAVFSMPAKSTGKWVSAAAVCTLEFKDGLIVNETWHYNGSVFH